MRINCYKNIKKMLIITLLLSGISSYQVYADTNAIITEEVTTAQLVTGRFDWFKEAQYIYKRGDDALVTDIETGKSFYMKRTFGTNHADVEPLTKEDTQIIKSIWGGWSWVRRAVTVEVNGYVIAASMTAYPHAGIDKYEAVKVVSGRSGGYGRGQNLDAVKGNGVDGHMDIHFLSSRTHGTNRVDSKHKQMVQKAYEYIQNLSF